MTEFEFSPKDEKVIQNFSYLIVAISGVILLGAGSSLVNFLHAINQNAVLNSIIWIILVIAHVAMAILFFKPYDNFVKITSTEGQDITELMTAFEELNVAFLFLLIFEIIMFVIFIINGGF